MPAAAVRRKGPVLYILTRRKGFVGGLVSYLCKLNYYKAGNTISLFGLFFFLFFLLNLKKKKRKN